MSFVHAYMFFGCTVSLRNVTDVSVVFSNRCENVWLLSRECTMPDGIGRCLRLKINRYAVTKTGSVERLDKFFVFTRLARLASVGNLSYWLKSREWPSQRGTKKPLPCEKYQSFETRQKVSFWGLIEKLTTNLYFKSRSFNYFKMLTINRIKNNYKNKMFWYIFFIKLKIWVLKLKFIYFLFMKGGRKSYLTTHYGRAFYVEQFFFAKHLC